ncbi:PilN domain-containing protein [Alteromonas sp. a30]|uniref:PilN domain-containing protein n=1 Tax=Alteromonas sp. a30 TaxID=2730917 RepID=UPI002280E15D|nr:PilN domain-containing protein [Alteromonas sp. a30]MCY7295298.1 pilus assembly protein CpaD [Alteromonas sp. a30]
MPHINLLPWREKLREKQKKQYIAVLLVVALASIGSMYLVGMVIEKMISNQNERNIFLQQQIAIVDVKIGKIKDIKNNKQALEKQIALIEQLQDSRNVAPKVVNELVKLTPSGVSFSSLKRTNRKIEVLGRSESNNHLSEFMRKLEASSLFINGELTSIVANTGSTDAGSEFKLNFEISPELMPLPAISSEKGGKK